MPPHPYFVACAFGFTEINESELKKAPEKNDGGVPSLHVVSGSKSHRIVRIPLNREAVVDAKDI